MRSGSKVGAKNYKKMIASTNDAYCPTLRGRLGSESALPEDVNSVLEIVVDGLDRPAIAARPRRRHRGCMPSRRRRDLGRKLRGQAREASFPSARAYPSETADLEMNVAILSSGRGWHTADLTRALEERGHQAHVLPIQALTAQVGAMPAQVGETPRLAIQGTALEASDAILLRTIPLGSLEQIIFRIDSLHWLERLSVPVLNPARVLERTVDKFYTSALLEEAGLRTPTTVVAQRREDAMKAFRMMGDVIVKPLFGSNGRGIVRVSDEEIAYRVFRALELERAVYYVQQALPSASGNAGRDLRVFVLGKRVLAAIWRSADGWRANLSRGARAEKAELPQAWEELALAAAEVVGAEYAGVDLLPTPDGEVYVLEVNGSPGWRGLGQTSEVDIAGAIVRHLEELVRSLG